MTGVAQKTLLPKLIHMNGNDCARRADVPCQQVVINGIIRTDPSPSTVPSRSEKWMSDRASRRSMLSIEKLSMR